VSRGVFISLVGVLAVLVVGGCGGGDDDGSLTQAEYKEQASEICSNRQREKSEGIEAAFSNPKKAQITGQGVKAQLEIFNELALPPIVTMTEELDALEPPSNQAKKAEAMVVAFEDEIKKMEADPKAVLNGDLGDFVEANKLARELSLKPCSGI